MNDDLSPLFSFRYLKWKLAWRFLFYHLISLTVLSNIVFVWSNNRDFFVSTLSKTIGVFLLLIIIINIVSTLITKEIQLYNRSIRKLMYFGLSIEIELNSCKIDGMRTPFFSTKKFIKSKDSVFLAPLFGVYYDENLAKNDDIKKMNSYLSEISGRPREDFEGNIIKINNLIVRDNHVG